MKIGAFKSCDVRECSCSHSKLANFPCLIFSPSISETLTIKRLTNCTLDISNEKIATGKLYSTAIFFAIESTKAVFPIAGRAAIMIKSDFCHPEVIWSR